MEKDPKSACLRDQTRTDHEDLFQLNDYQNIPTYQPDSQYKPNNTEESYNSKYASRDDSTNYTNDQSIHRMSLRSAGGTPFLQSGSRLNSVYKKQETLHEDENEDDNLDNLDFDNNFAQANDFITQQSPKKSIRFSVLSNLFKTGDANSSHPKSFYLYIAVSLICFILVAPFQIFLLVDAVAPSSFNSNTNLVSLYAQAYDVCSGLLIFARFYQLFITVIALITKNTILASYLLIYLILIFISSVKYMLTFLDTIDGSPNGEKTMVKFSVYWIIVISAVAILLQGLLFFSKLKKDLSWQRFKSLNSSISTRNTILAIQNYKALLILNGFFLIFELVVTINFPYKFYYGEYDGFSILSMVLIGLTPFVLSGLYYFADKGMSTPIVFGMGYIMFIYLMNVLASYFFATYSWTVLAVDSTHEDNTISTNGTLYFDYIFLFRNWFAFFHYSLIFANFAMSINLVKIFSSKEFKTSMFLTSKFKFKRLDQNPLNSQNNLKSFSETDNLQQDNNELSNKNKIKDLETKIRNLLKFLFLFFILLTILGVAFNAYVLTVAKNVLGGWFALTLESVVGLLGFNLAGFYCYSTNQYSKTKYLILLCIPVIFTWFNSAIYQMFIIFNHCLYYNYKGIIQIYAVPQSLFQIYYLTLYDANQSTHNKTLIDQDLQLVQQANQNLTKILPDLVPNKAASTTLSILSTAITFIALLLISIGYAKLCSWIDELERRFEKVDVGESLTRLEKFFTHLKMLNYMVIFFGISSMLLICLFPEHIYNDYYADPGKELRAGTSSKIAFGVITAFWSCLFGAVIFLRENSKFTLIAIFALLFLWIPLICYEFYYTYYYYSAYYTVLDMINGLIPIMANLVLELILILFSLAYCGFIFFIISSDELDNKL